jgi:hypothetical protein
MVESIMKTKQPDVKTDLLRYLLSLSTGIVVLLLVGFDGFVSVPVGAFGAEASIQAANTTRDPVEPLYSVVSPLGDSTVDMITMAPRLDSLQGRTVCMVWNHAFKADVTLPAIGASLKNRYPDVKIVPYTEIDAAIRAAERDGPSTEAETLRTVMKEKGCDALIAGNGG